MRSSHQKGKIAPRPNRAAFAALFLSGAALAQQGDYLRAREHFEQALR